MRLVEPRPSEAAFTIPPAARSNQASSVRHVRCSHATYDEARKRRAGLLDDDRHRLRRLHPPPLSNFRWQRRVLETRTDGGVQELRQGGPRMRRRLGAMGGAFLG